MRLIPESSALWMTRIESSGSELPTCVANISAPSPYGLTLMPVLPRVRYCIESPVLRSPVAYPCPTGMLFRNYTETYSVTQEESDGTHRCRLCDPVGSVEPRRDAPPAR